MKGYLKTLMKFARKVLVVVSSIDNTDVVHFIVMMELIFVGISFIIGCNQLMIVVPA